MTHPAKTPSEFRAFIVGTPTALPPGMTMTDKMTARREQQIRELASDLADLVASGDLTEQQANEWLVAKQDQWFGGDR